MNEMSMTTLIAAGQIKEDDEIIGFIQNISVQQANHVATWLVLATGGPVKLQHVDLSAQTTIELTGPTDPRIKVITTTAMG